ncbi:hypothetical protein EVAR_6451_1 [Eumeta japonica]|uniref:Uncharacterized protein n=1 Tax=Eumeta variegata TaxID=151549 RepID=A0A4C1SPN6_EUMVA|nr:hypothetical protein EVAR_6451_1 [Eumeta japonica]
MKSCTPPIRRVMIHEVAGSFWNENREKALCAVTSRKQAVYELLSAVLILSILPPQDNLFHQEDSNLLVTPLELRVSMVGDDHLLSHGSQARSLLGNAIKSDSM